MDNWKPISLDELNIEIENGFLKLDIGLQTLWKQIRIEPEKWVEREYGNEGERFWVVAIIGKKVIWYNDIEEGFNLSSFSIFGECSLNCVRCFHPQGRLASLGGELSSSNAA